MNGVIKEMGNSLLIEKKFKCTKDSSPIKGIVRFFEEADRIKVELEITEAFMGFEREASILQARLRWDIIMQSDLTSSLVVFMIPCGDLEYVIENFRNLFPGCQLEFFE